jgi:hypothetical protein
MSSLSAPLGDDGGEVGLAMPSMRTAHRRAEHMVAEQNFALRSV